jgi:tetratricopeptide (TPR) repeat protein
MGGESVVLGAFGPYILAGFGASLRYRRFRAAYLHALMAFLISMPVIYALTSLVYAILAWAHLCHIEITQFLLQNLIGTLVGVGLGVLFSLAAALKSIVDDKPKDGDLSFGKIFAAVLSFRLIFAFVVASLFNLPDRPSAIIALGTAWGIVAAGILVFYTTVIASTEISAVWIPVTIYESVLGVILLWNILFSFIGWMKFEPQLELILPVLAVLPATCGLVCLIGIKGRQAIRALRALTRNELPSSPAAYLPDLAVSLTSQANMLSEVGRVEEALAVAGESVTIRRQLAEASPAAYLPDLAVSLTSQANMLSEAGELDRAESLFEEVLGRFVPDTLGLGHLFLARGRWRAARDRLADAIFDLVVALRASDDTGDYVTRGQVRALLRSLRGDGHQASFDGAWEQASEPLPVWLQYPNTEELLSESVIAWVQAPDWRASRTYLLDNAPTLLTDQAEAALEHLIDINPGLGELRIDLELLRQASAYGPHSLPPPDRNFAKRGIGLRFGGNALKLRRPE